MPKYEYNDFVLVSKNHLHELLQGYFELMALERGGVDDWEWYGESISDFLKEYHSEDFEELAEKLLPDYIATQGNEVRTNGKIYH